jgi:hypothetical protein
MNDPILALFAEHGRAERTMARHEWDEDSSRRWKPARDTYLRSQSKLLRSKPVTFEGAGTLVAFVARGLSIAGYDWTVDRLKKQSQTLRRGKLDSSVWIWLRYADLLLTKNMPRHPGLRIFRRAIRSVLHFVQAKGGKVDPRRLSIRPA